MKIPAVAIVAVFACGIALGLCFPVAHPYPSAAILTIYFSAAALLILTGILLSKFEKLALAAITSLLSWLYWELWVLFSACSHALTITCSH